MSELVGDAYIRITADTTPMVQAVKRAAKQDGKAYKDAFTKEVNDIADANTSRARRRLAEGLADPKEFTRMAASFDSATDAAESWRKKLLELKDLGQINGNDLRIYNKAIRDWEESTKRAHKASADLALQQKQEDEATRGRIKSLKQMFDLQTRSYNLRVKQANQKATGDPLDAILPDRNKFARAMATLDTQLTKVDNRFLRVNTSIGRAFGKGSRNNFVNWVGSMVGGLSTLATSLITFPLRAVATIGDKFETAFSVARANGLTAMASAGRGLLAVFGGKGGLVGTIAGLGVGVFALSKVLPGVVSLMSMLGGVVSALVGSIGIGLTGALLGLVPAAAGAVTGIGALAGVFVSFFKDADNEKFVANFLKPFRDMNKSYFPEVKKFLTNIRGGFDDLIKDIRPSIDTFFRTFQDRFDDPSTQSALSKWSDSIGKIANSLSSASTGFLSGLTKFFVPVLPYAERLAVAIDDIAISFNEWVSKGANQNKIAEFMETAWVAADKVWRILGNIGGILGDVFMGGEETGTGFLDGILTKLQDINDYLDTPRGQAAMKDWFGDVKIIGEDIGSLAVSVGEIVKNLNSPEGRENARILLDTITGIANAAVTISELADDIGRIVGFIASPAIGTLAALFGNGAAAKQSPDPVTPQKAVVDIETFLNGKPTGSGPTGGLQSKIKEELGVNETQKRLATYVIDVSMDTRLYDSTKKIIEDYRFHGKTVDVRGNTAEWDAVKGTVAGYAFNPKEIEVYVDDRTLAEQKRKITRWLNSLPSEKRIRVAGVTGQGGITVNAAGALHTRPTFSVTGEAGPEAIVPLARPLNQVDPAVRALSAFAQGKGQTGGSGSTAGRVLNIAKGAITVMLPTGDPELAAQAVFDRIVTHTGG